jgi:mRNA-degrading endonuclease YafQ of YafQ-DinJ toxin-antitoxin module
LSKQYKKSFKRIIRNQKQGTTGVILILVSCKSKRIYLLRIVLISNDKKQIRLVDER